MTEQRRFKLHNGKGGAALAVRVTPRSARNEIAGVLEDGTIKVRLTAPPVEGKANEALVRFLADILKVPPSKIEIIAGETGRDKLVTVLDVDAETVNQRITAQME